MIHHSASINNLNILFHISCNKLKKEETILIEYDSSICKFPFYISYYANDKAFGISTNIIFFFEKKKNYIPTIRSNHKVLSK